MKFQLRALFFTILLATILFLKVGGLVQGQGPVSFSTWPTPTPAAGDPAPSTAPIVATSLADLIVSNIQTSPASPFVGQPTLISITIKNNSNINLTFGNNFNTDLYIDPPINPVINYHQIVNPALGLPWGVQSFWVPANGSHVLTTTWVFTQVQTYELWAQVDSDNSVIEENEDNNTYKANITVLTPKSFKHTTHKDFLINMASTLDNDDPTGVLRLGRFAEPPYYSRPYATGGQIAPAVSDYNMMKPDTELPTDASGMQINPYLATNSTGVVIAVWEDSRKGDLLDRDIYLRYSTNYGQSWGPEIQVNADLAGINQSNPVAALSKSGNLLVAWQDRRNGNYDIYAQHYLLSGNTLNPVGANIRVDSDVKAQDQINPDIAVDEEGNFYVVWQDKRNGNYDIFTISYIFQGGNYVWSQERRVNDDTKEKQQSNPAINVIDWFQVTGIAYKEDNGTIVVTEVFSTPKDIVVVVWEDYSQDNADVAITLSTDRGETFSFDDFVNDDAQPLEPPQPNAPNQLDPDVALTTGKELVSVIVQLSNGSEASVAVEVPVTAIHTVWQDFRSGTAANPNPDIYYSRSQLGITQEDNIFEIELNVGPNEKINQGDNRDWQTGPVIQQGPAIDVVRCAPLPGEPVPENQWNRFIVWADGRNYDNTNYDIYYTIRSDCGANFPGNEMLNDGVRLHNFNPTLYSDYNPSHPPSARQVNPSVAVNIRLNGSKVYGGYLYLAWEDDRAGNPQTEKDIFFARSNLTFANQPPYNFFNDGAGSQISNILDSGTTDTTWYTVSWSGATDNSTYITIQTRLGNTITETLASDWYPKRYPFQPQPGDPNALTSGAPLAGYSAPGQNIENAQGNFRPKARYIQYRVNFYSRDETKSPELYDLTIYYNSGVTSGEDPTTVYLPLIQK